MCEGLYERNCMHIKSLLPVYLIFILQYQSERDRKGQNKQKTRTWPKQVTIKKNKKLYFARVLLYMENRTRAEERTITSLFKV